MENRVSQCVQRIRDRVNEPRARETYSKIPERWQQLGSSMDFLGDIALALSAYRKNEAKETFGERYLRAYGALQALVVQQDAVKHLQGLGIAVPSPHGKLEHIRDIRVRSIGHPTETWKTRSRPRLFSFITRMSLGRAGFELRSYSGTGEELVEGIDVWALISVQDSILGDQLIELEARLANEEKKHRTEFAEREAGSLVPGHSVVCIREDQRRFAPRPPSEYRDLGYRSGQGESELISRSVDAARDLDQHVSWNRNRL